jgi:hypothetical protein
MLVRVSDCRASHDHKSTFGPEAGMAGTTFCGIATNRHHRGTAHTVTTSRSYLLVGSKLGSRVGKLGVDVGRMIGNCGA